MRDILAGKINLADSGVSLPQYYYAQAPNIKDSFDESKVPNVLSESVLKQNKASLDNDNPASPSWEKQQKNSLHDS